jgi:glutamine cyclotransferase
LYEGTGQYGASSIRRVDLASGRVEKIHSIDREYFGEGITILGNKLYEITWKSGLAFVYDLDTFNVVQTFQYPTEGWGLTHDGEHLIMSDGTATLRFLDPMTFKSQREITVHDGDEPIAKLNELEFVEGEIWSNVWYDDRIARISPADGRVVGWIDLADIYPHSARRGDDVLNGIAYDAASRKIYVTGKNWPQLYQIDVIRR